MCLYWLNSEKNHNLYLGSEQSDHCHETTVDHSSQWERKETFHVPLVTWFTVESKWRIKHIYSCCCFCKLYLFWIIDFWELIIFFLNLKPIFFTVLKLVLKFSFLDANVRSYMLFCPLEGTKHISNLIVGSQVKLMLPYFQRIPVPMFYIIVC